MLCHVVRAGRWTARECGGLHGYVCKRRTVSVVEIPREPHYIGGCPERWLYYGHKVHTHTHTHRAHTHTHTKHTHTHITTPRVIQKPQIVLTALPALPPIPLPAPPPSPCPSPQCLLLHLPSSPSEGKSWRDAQFICSSFQGSLVAIEDEIEQGSSQTLEFKQPLSSCYINHLYCGLYCLVWAIV